MAEANASKLYKNASLEGIALPFDVLLFHSSMKQDFSATAANDIALPSTEPIPELLIIFGDPDEDCWIQLDGNAVVPANGTFVANLLFVQAGSIVTVDRNGAENFGVVSASGNAGTIQVIAAHAYSDARKQQRITRP